MFTINQNDELLNKLNACEAKISGLADKVTTREENAIKSLSSLNVSQ